MTLTTSPNSKTHLNSDKGRLRGRIDRKAFADLERENLSVVKSGPFKDLLPDNSDITIGPDNVMRLRYTPKTPSDPNSTVSVSIETQKTGEAAITRVAFTDVAQLTDRQWNFLKNAVANGATQSEAVAVGKALEAALGSLLNLDHGLSIENTRVSGANLHREALHSRTYKEVTWDNCSLRSDLSNTEHKGGGMKTVDACRANLSGSKFTNKFVFVDVTLVGANLDRVEVGPDCTFHKVNVQKASLIGMKIGGVLLTDFIMNSTPDQIKATLKGVIYDKETIFCDTSTDVGKKLQKDILAKLDLCSTVHVPTSAGDRGLLTKDTFLNRLASDLGVTTMSQGNTVFIPLASIGRTGSLGVTMRDAKNPQEGGFGTLRHYDDSGKVSNVPVMEKNQSYALDALEVEIYRILNEKRGVKFDPNEVVQPRKIN